MVETNFKAEAKLVLPEKVDSNIGCSVKVLSEGVASLCKLPEKIFDIVTKSGATLFRPLAAYLNGRAAIMEARSFVDSQNIRKELSQFQLAINVAQNLAVKQQAGQEVPKEIVDTNFVIAQGDKIIYPESWQNKSIVDYTNACLETLDIKTS